MDFTLCLTHDCNLRCAYCYAGDKRPRAMTWEVAQRSVDFCYEQTLRRAELLHLAPQAQIGFFGGEPLLEWNLLQRAFLYARDEAQRLGIGELRRTVTTNLTLLTEPRADWLLEQGFHIGLSLDGHAAMHDTLRRFADGRGSHAACARALRPFRGRERGAEVVLVVDPRNVAHLADSVAWLAGEGMRHISLNPNFYIEWPEGALATWRTHMERLADLYVHWYRCHVPVRINVFDGKIRTRLQEGYAPCDRCGFGDQEIAIAASGNIYPCERIVADDAANEPLCIGNVFDGFNPERRSRVVAERGNIVGDCEECGLGPRCMNWCSCINLGTTGAINRVSGIVCFHERMVIAAADRAAATLYAEKNLVFLHRFYA
jgi:uncharacterized protein